MTCRIVGEWRLAKPERFHHSDLHSTRPNTRMAQGEQDGRDVKFGSTKTTVFQNLWTMRKFHKMKLTRCLSGSSLTRGRTIGRSRPRCLVYDCVSTFMYLCLPHLAVRFSHISNRSFHTTFDIERLWSSIDGDLPWSRPSPSSRSADTEQSFFQKIEWSVLIFLSNNHILAMSDRQVPDPKCT